MKKALLWDRDGVINSIEVKDGISLSPRKMENFKIFNHIKDLMLHFSQHGFLNIVITNQPDISRGLMEPSELEKMNDHLKSYLPIDKIYICPHSNKDNCNCRKPKPGMILSAFNDFNLDPLKCVVVGDRVTDIIAGYNAGIKSLFLLKRSYSFLRYSNYDLPNYKTISSLKELPILLS